MQREADLLFALFALRAGEVPRQRILECAMEWAEGAGLRFDQLMIEQSLLTAEQGRRLESEVLAEIERHGGDANKALLAAPVDPEMRWILGASLMRAAGPAAAPSGHKSPAVVIVRPGDGRYNLGKELGRGGLGQVLSARDSTLDRSVALKLLLPGLSPTLEARFVKEARLTARLQHPNIVPVHDFGSLKTGDGAPQLFICMKRIDGRDLASVLRAVAAGEAESARVYTRPRLLRIFQDVCLAVAFAHSKGVIHRDLKPSNVMLGEFGEVLLVDWGLAKQQDSVDAPEPAHPVEAPVFRAGVDEGTALTLQGDVLGTPSYMSPEQARGNLDEVDERSDIFGLGTILYVILAFQAPFPGLTADDALSLALAGQVTPPSRFRQVPPELEAICMKALAPVPQDRFKSAMELHDEIQLFLEGVKDRERNHRLAEGAVERARAAMERQKRLETEARQAAEEALQKRKKLKPLDDKAELWGLEDRAKELGSAGVDAFSEANAELSLALTHEPAHVEARRLRAELYWVRYLGAEGMGDEKEMRVNRSIVERYNDGQFDALLKGDGTLAVRTRTYACRCLLDGCMVNPDELEWQEYHPFSGRGLGKHSHAEGSTELEPRRPVRLKVHAANCEPVPVEGADVWLFRYEEIGRRLFPVTPSEMASSGNRPVPQAAVDGTFEKESPYRPHGPGVWLGRTPIQKRALPMGSYLLLVASEGRSPVRVPVSVPRCGHWEQEVTLFRPDEVPPGFIPISAGSFGFQGDPEATSAGPPESRVVDDVFISRHPVTCREYCEFLNDLARTRPEEAAKRVPRESQESSFHWAGPPYAVATAEWLSQATPQMKSDSRRLTNCAADWESDWPVFDVSWEDAMAYCAWTRERDGRLTTLPHELDWEKSARGTDRRTFPWGWRWDNRWAIGNSYSAQGGARPVGVRECPSDESPYGVRGLGGNSRDLCLNGPGAEYPNWRLSRGGFWTSDGDTNSRVAGRSWIPKRLVVWVYGFRVAAMCRLSRSG